MAAASSADVRRVSLGHIIIALHTAPAVLSLMTRVGVSTIIHPMDNTASQRQVMMDLCFIYSNKIKLPLMSTKFNIETTFCQPMGKTIADQCPLIV